MRIVNGWLESDGECTVEIMKSPNYGTTPQFQRKGIAFHWDGAASQGVACRSIMTRGAASAHYNVGRDGKIVQFVSLDNWSWHAGLPDGLTWPNPDTGETMQASSNPNYYFIGIEYANAGMISNTEPKRCCYLGNGGWGAPVPDSMKLREFNPPLENFRYWEDIYDEQAAAMRLLVKTLIVEYQIERQWCVDHRYLMPSQKSDCISIDWRSMVDGIYDELA